MAQREGLKTLAQVGQEKVIKGETSLDELCRVVVIDQALPSKESQQPKQSSKSARPQAKQPSMAQPPPRQSKKPRASQQSKQLAVDEVTVD